MATRDARMEIVIVTGVSGAGKSTALKALEDTGYFCVDNLPLPLLGRFVELLSHSGEVRKTALVIDAREGDFLSGAREAFETLRGAGHIVEVLFLDAPDDDLVRRFSETRRRHPLGGDDVRGGIKQERAMIAGLREEAQNVVDTALMNVHQLKRIILERFSRSGSFALTLLSFGFKYGVPVEADMVLDVRFLPNPYFVPALSPHSGLEPEVSAYVLAAEDAPEFLDRIEGLLAFLVPRVEAEGKGYFTVAVGCTGGRHRSVAIAAELGRRLGQRHLATVRHRDLARGGG